jgi:hypothetical protein
MGMDMFVWFRPKENPMTAFESTQDRWLNCQIDQGMFSDEMAVSYPPNGQTILSVFVPASLVKGSPGHRGKVRVVVMQRQGKTFAVLPSTDRSIVSVAEHDISESP